MGGRADVIVTVLVLVSLAGAIAMPVLFAWSAPYGAACAGVDACYALLLAWFLMDYDGRRK